MKAVVFEKFGEPAEVLRVKDVPEPKPGKSEIKVRMLASPINPSDLMTVRGIYGKLPELPATPGFEGVGVVVEANAGLFGQYLKGKRVAVMNRGTGNWKEFAVIPAKQAIPLSNDLPVEQAAMFFVNPATAYVMTQKVLQVPPGAWLLQTAAGSALGKMVIRLGKKFGFKTMNVVRRPEQVDELKQLGGDMVFKFNDREDDPATFREQVLKAHGGEGIHYAIDPVGGKTASAVVNCLGSNGRLLLYGTLTDEPIAFSPRTIMTHTATVEGFWLARWMNTLGLMAKLKLIRTITGLIRSGELTSEVGEMYPLEQIATAVRESEKPGRGGKTLLKIGEA